MGVQERILFRMASRRLVPPSEEDLTSYLSADYSKHVKTPSTIAFDDGPVVFRLFGEQVLSPAMFKNMRVLDIGSGLGGRTVYYGTLDAAEVTGIEPNAHFHGEAEKFLAYRGQRNVRFVQGCAEQLPFPDASFDMVISVDSLEHVADPLATLREIRRVLTPGGAAFISFPPIHHPKGDHLHDVFDLKRVHWFFSRQTMIKVYKKLAANQLHGQEKIQQKIRMRDGREEFHHINWMTYSQFRGYVRTASLRVSNLDVKPLYPDPRIGGASSKSRRRGRELLHLAAFHFSRWASKIPLLREAFIGRVVVKLVPAPQASA